MTERKPARMDFDSWIDQQIREAQERGEFDDLPGKGKPIRGLEQPADEMWWVRGWLQREGVTVQPPAAIGLRKEVQDLQDRLEREPTEARVRAVVEELNGRIRQANRMPPIDGPPTTVAPLDVDVVVERWRARREELAAANPPAEPEPTIVLDEPAPRRKPRRWWTRRLSPSS